MIILFDEMRAPVRMVAGGSQGGYPPANTELQCPSGAEGCREAVVRLPSLNSLPGGEAMRNATVAGQDFRGEA